MNKVDKKDQLLPHVVARLNTDQKANAIAALFNHEQSYLNARDKIKPEMLNRPDEGYLRAALICLTRVYERLGSTIFTLSAKARFNTFKPEAIQVLEEGGSSYTPIDYTRLVDEFLPHALINNQPSDFSDDETRSLIGRLLAERMVGDAWADLSRLSRDGVLSNVTEVAQGLLDRAAKAKLLEVDPVESMAPTGWRPVDYRLRSTGVPFLDNFLRGGHRSPETYALLGVTGAGKTTLGLQIAIGTAELEQMWADLPKTRPAWMVQEEGPTHECKHSYYFHYEMSRDDIRAKAWSCASMIDETVMRRVLSNNGSFEGVADAALQDLEASLLARARVAVQTGEGLNVTDLSPQERFNYAKSILGVNCWQVDCTGNGTNAGLGSGYIQEVAAVLRNELATKGRKPAVVILDYAGLVVSNHTDDKDRAYALLSRFGKDVEHYISVPFETPVWILQQLSGQANARTAATRQHHADAAGCKRFAENCWFALNIGTADERDGIRQISCSKARRSNLGSPPVLRICGGYNRLVDVSHQYTFDRSGKARSLHGTEPLDNMPAGQGPNYGQPALPPAYSEFEVDTIDAELVPPVDSVALFGQDANTPPGVQVEHVTPNQAGAPTDVLSEQKKNSSFDDV